MGRSPVNRGRYAKGNGSRFWPDSRRSDANWTRTVEKFTDTGGRRYGRERAGTLKGEEKAYLFLSLARRFRVRAADGEMQRRKRRRNGGENFEKST